MKSSGSHDLGIEIKLGLDCLNSDEQTARYKAMSPKRARRAGMEPGRPILAILNEFMDEKICGVMKKDPWDAMRAFRDLERVLHSLVYGVRHPEFKGLLETVEACRAHMAEALCQMLVKRYRDLSTPPEELPGLNAALVACIEAGAWPTWREDIDGWGRERDDAA
jgi:hypothetical protein